MIGWGGGVGPIGWLRAVPPSSLAPTAFAAGWSAGRGGRVSECSGNPANQAEDALRACAWVEM